MNSGGFWPHTLGSWAAIIAAIGTLLVGIGSMANRRAIGGNAEKLDEVHGLVNGNLHQAQDDLKSMTDERDILRGHTDEEAPPA